MRPFFLAAALAFVAAGAYGAGNGEPRQGTQAPAQVPAQAPAQAPELGAGPHQDFQPMEGGNGDRLRPGFPKPQVPTPKNPDAGKAGASTGSSARPSEQQDPEDERRATERKEKAKQRPGYKDEAPSPRAANPSPRAAASGPGRVN